MIQAAGILPGKTVVVLSVLTAQRWKSVLRAARSNVSRSLS